MVADNDELQRRLAEIEAREADLNKRERALSARGLRHNLYSRIDLSLGTINAIIIACAVAIVALVIVGSMMGR